MKLFFSYTGDYGGFETYATEAEARANIAASFDALMDGGPRYFQDEVEEWCCGELRWVIRSGEVVALDARPDSGWRACSKRRLKRREVRSEILQYRRR